MKGYDGDGDGTSAVIQPDGWLRTSDLGEMREDGCLPPMNKPLDAEPASNGSSGG